MLLEEFRSLGIDFVSFQESIDTASPLGIAVFTIVSAIAQLERDIIAERVKAGMRRARKAGKAIGRPKAQVDMMKFRRLHREGKSVRQMARILKVSKSTVERLIKRVSQKALESSPPQTLQYGAIW